MNPLPNYVKRFSSFSPVQSYALRVVKGPKRPDAISHSDANFGISISFIVITFPRFPNYWKHISISCNLFSIDGFVYFKKQKNRVA